MARGDLDSVCFCCVGVRGSLSTDSENGSVCLFLLFLLTASVVFGRLFRVSIHTCVGVIGIGDSVVNNRPKKTTELPISDDFRHPKNRPKNRPKNGRFRLKPLADQINDRKSFFSVVISLKKLGQTNLVQVWAPGTVSYWAQQRVHAENTCIFTKFGRVANCCAYYCSFLFESPYIIARSLFLSGRYFLNLAQKVSLWLFLRLLFHGRILLYILHSI